MATKTWFGGSGSFLTSSDWAPAGAPAAGDTAIFDAGTLIVSRLSLDGVTLDQGGSAGAPTVLKLDDAILGNAVFSPAPDDVGSVSGGNQTIDVSHIAVLDGTIGVQALVDTITINLKNNSALFNLGTIDFLPGSGGSIDVTGGSGAVLVNAGLIELGAQHNPAITIRPDIIGTGTIELNAPDDLDLTTRAEFGGLVGAGQTIEMNAAPFLLSGASITIDNPREFHATITDFAANDFIDLKNTTVTSDVFSNGVLTLQDAAKPVAQLKFSGSYATSDFVVQQQSNDTVITHV